MRLIIAALILAFAIFFNSIELSSQSDHSESDLSVVTPRFRSISRSGSRSPSTSNQSGQSVQSVQFEDSASSTLEYSGFGRSLSSSERRYPNHLSSSSSSEQSHQNYLRSSSFSERSHSRSVQNVNSESSNLEYSGSRGFSSSSERGYYPDHSSSSISSGRTHSGVYAPPLRHHQIPVYSESVNKQNSGPSRPVHFPPSPRPLPRLPNLENEPSSPNSSSGSNFYP